MEFGEQCLDTYLEQSGSDVQWLGEWRAEGSNGKTPAFICRVWQDPNDIALVDQMNINEVSQILA